MDEWRIDAALESAPAIPILNHISPASPRLASPAQGALLRRVLSQWRILPAASSASWSAAAPPPASTASSARSPSRPSTRDSKSSASATASRTSSRATITHVRPLTIADVAPFYQPRRVASSAPAAPTRPRIRTTWPTCSTASSTLGIKYLVTIGGDDTAFSGSQVYANADGRDPRRPRAQDDRQRPARCPPGIPTFGFETARHFGVQIVRNLAEDARTTTRWYLIVSMGRAAGHLALGIGKASAATLTIIPEEFQAAGTCRSN